MGNPEKTNNEPLKILIVLDEGVNWTIVNQTLKQMQGGSVDFFSLTGKYMSLSGIRRELSPELDLNFKFLSSGKSIDEALESLRPEILRWSLELGELPIWGKSLKRWFVLPGTSVSSWWLSLIAEKNTLKSESFFHLAQVRALERLFQRYRYHLCLIAIKDLPLQRSIKRVALSACIPIRAIQSRVSKLSTNRVKEFLKATGLLGEVLAALSLLMTYVKHHIIVRNLLGKFRERYVDEADLLFVNYFPLVDESAAKKAIFRNKYAEPLHSVFNELGTKVVWLMMYVPLYGYDYKSAAKLAARFVSFGEKIFFLEEFCSIRIFVRTLILWIRQIILSKILLREVALKKSFGEWGNQSFFPIFKSLWEKSFSGHVGIEGILFYLTFANALNKLPTVGKCLYFCEMHAWEKALNAARNEKSPHTFTIGFQHTSISRNYLHYFHAPEVFKIQGTREDQPVPDRFACNGRLTQKLFQESGYPNLAIVEAVRQMYLAPIMATEVESNPSEPLLLVAGSVNRTESRNLVAMVHSAFPHADQFEIWFKSHPSLDLSVFFNEIGIDISTSKYRICRGQLQGLLRQARAVIVPSSTVAIEAFAFGCEVIVPVFPDIMVMNPLSDFPGTCHKVAGPEELKSTVAKIMRGGILKSGKERREFISDYWCLKKDLSGWKKILAADARGWTHRE